MWWELCDGSSENLVDLCGDGSLSWRKAKSYFRNKGYYGKFILIHRCRNSFKLYDINIKQGE